jgi:hypothetical protein
MGFNWVFKGLIIKKRENWEDIEVNGSNIQIDFEGIRW